MSLDLPGLHSALQLVLARPGLRAEATLCRARIELQVQSEAGDGLVLWPGENGGSLIRLRASNELWCEVFAALPPVGRQSLGALRRQCPDFAIEGPELAVAQALPFIEGLLDGLRWQFNGLPKQAHADRSSLRHIKGRYLALDAAGEDWVHAEHAGLDPGPPLLMLHTAGADARQWHGLMGQLALRESWSLHAFDLPGHGRSPLPGGAGQEPWRLSEAQYLKWVIGYLDAAGLERVALLGCSMGSAIGLALLARHPQRFAGAVLLEAPYRSPGRRSIYLNHPEVHGARLGAAWVGSLLSPSSPRAGRDDATWIYSQAAPGIYDGDLAYYSDDFDAHHHTPHISTVRTPLWLMTGNYDYSATPADSQRVAAEIAGAHFNQLPGFGHFPMVEDPLALMAHLQAPLRAIRQRFS